MPQHDFSINSFELSADMRSELRSLASNLLHDHSDSIASLHVTGWASPDGKESLNTNLSKNRAVATAFFLGQLLEVPQESCLASPGGENWSQFSSCIDADPIVPCKQQIRKIIDSDADNDTKEHALRNLKCDNHPDSPSPWTYLVNNIFPKLRSVEIIIRFASGDSVSGFISDSGTSVDFIQAPASDKTDACETDTIPDEPTPPPLMAKRDDASPLHAYVKTNIPAWAMLWTNAAGELDFAPHWSAALSVYYSGFNYFHSDRKFRTLAIMPEVRYWLRNDNQGFFIAPHFGMAWYNCAFGGDLRYQDHNGNTPAIGGGASIGFRFNISRNRRWKLEASVGYGIYRLDYDTFVNKHNGALTGRRQRTFYGFDNAAISLCYMFDLPRKSTPNTLSQ